jgi:kynurenine formamidase
MALKNTMILEALVHLHEIPVEHSMSFDLQTSPVRIVGATGGPVVAYAYIGI